MKILLVDDHIVVREGVRRLLATLPGATLGEASSGHEALSLFRKEHWDLVLLDLGLADISGLELLRRLRLEDETARVLVFSMYAEPIYAARALKAGACGYVSKSAPAEELISAVSRIAGGGRYVEQDIAVALATARDPDTDPLRQLTAREIDILRLLGEGRSLAAIADGLGVAYKTVANSCSIMKAKLGVERTADLIRLSIEMRHI